MAAVSIPDHGSGYPVGSLDNSGWKGPQKVSTPASFSKQGIRMYPSIQVLKTSRDGDCPASMDEPFYLIDCLHGEDMALLLLLFVSWLLITTYLLYYNNILKRPMSSRILRLLDDRTDVLAEQEMLLHFIIWTISRDCSCFTIFCRNKGDTVGVFYIAILCLHFVVYRCSWCRDGLVIFTYFTVAGWSSVLRVAEVKEWDL